MNGTIRSTETTAKMEKKRKPITAIPVGSGGHGNEEEGTRGNGSLQHFAIIS